MKLSGYIDDTLSLFYPRTCMACGNTLFRHEDILCTFCLFHLPKTNFHKDADNPVSRIFWGRVSLISASAYYHFGKGGKVQHLIHQLKYKGHKEIGVFIGRLYGNELLEEPLYGHIDRIIPVPLHRSKAAGAWPARRCRRWASSRPGTAGSVTDRPGHPCKKKPQAG